MARWKGAPARALLLRLLLPPLLLLLPGGCAPVPAWDRETLATERMRLDADPGEQALLDTRRAVREEGHVGAPGSATSGAAGGCGCN